MLDDVRIDVEELATLLAELVDLASDLTAAEPVESLSLGDLARTVAGRTERRTGRAVTVNEGVAEAILGRPRQLERSISNLVDHAVKYSPTGGPVEIVVERTCVAVRDSGPGVASEDVEHIFDRFYRSVHARPLPGSGLGLSIVDEIVRATVARYSPETGSTVAPRMDSLLRPVPASREVSSSYAIPTHLLRQPAGWPGC